MLCDSVGISEDVQLHRFEPVYSLNQMMNRMMPMQHHRKSGVYIETKSGHFGNHTVEYKNKSMSMSGMHPRHWAEITPTLLIMQDLNPP